MKPPFPNRAAIARPCSLSGLVRNGTSTEGVALVIVLCMLALAAILLVAFLNSVAIELRSAKSYAVGLDARSLSDSAVNIVLSQIQDATATPTNAWASQPGLIRTYNPSGNLVMAYKLYSAGVMRTNSFNPVTSVTSEVPSNWATLPDQYTDLNRPVTNSAGVIYPIIDPGAVGTSQSVTNAAMDGTTNPIQGCYIDQTSSDASICVSGGSANPVPMPVKWLYVLQDGTICTISSAGTISGLSSTGTTISPTTANPIVGRIAFWTDDESCKVNINTSGEGTFWGPPHAESTYVSAWGHLGVYSGYERDMLAYGLPAQNEFQRYPGHPAMTSLSVIFPMLSGETVPQYNERIYGIIPRLGTGGTQSGTVVVLAANDAALPFPTVTTTAPVPNNNRLFASVDEFLFSATNTIPRTMNLKEGTSPSGIAFTQSDIEKTRFFLTTSSRAPEVNMFNKPRICLWPLQANTVTNSVITPAPACWTATDKLIAFCSTLGGANGTPYYFQRYNTFDPATIRTSQTYPASLSQSPIPSSQSPTLDWTLNAPGAVNRNQTLYTYLQYLTSNPIPGLGGSFSGSSGTYKYSPSVRDQLITEIVDFIRSEVTTTCIGTTPTYFYAPSQMNGTPITGEHQVVPLEFNPPIYPGNGAAWSSTGNTNNYTTKGFGRFETIQQAAFVFYRMDPAAMTNTVTTNAVTSVVSTNYYLAAQNFTSNNAPYGVSTNTPNTNTSVNVGCVLLLNPYNVTPGLRSWQENMRVQVTLNPAAAVGRGGSPPVMQANGAGFNGPVLPYTTNGCPANPFMTGNAPSTNTVLLNGNNCYYQVDGTAMISPEGFWAYFNNTGSWPPILKTLGTNVVGSSTEEQFYPFYGSFTLTNSPTQSTFNFIPPASITIQTYSGYDPGATTNGVPSPSALVQTINMSFPTNILTLPVPTASIANGTHSGKPISNYNNRPGGMFDSPSGGSDPSSYLVYTSGSIASGSDLARCIETRYGGAANNLPRGDMRMVAGLANVPTNYFDSYGAIGSDDVPAGSTANGYYASTNAVVHSLRMNPVGGVDFQNNSGVYSGYAGSLGSLISPASQGYNNANRICTYPDVPRGLSCTNVVLSGQTYPNGRGDWDTGPGDQPDGPYINKVQEGVIETATQLNNGDSYGDFYMQGFNVNRGGEPNQETGISYSPNRLISSAVAFGSLPTGIDPNTNNATLVGAAPVSGSQSSGGQRPWQTLLFCPNPTSEAGNNGAPIHPGFGYNGTATNAPPYTIPPDHAFLDFFTMPIVQPYAISEPFSTAGKVNMNYQIVPFTYLNRDTALRAVLKSVRMMAIPLNNGGDGSATYGSISYKGGNGSPPDYRYTINPDEATGTLAGFQYRFATGDIFRSASEICNLYLVPQYSVGCTSAGGGELIPGANGAGTSGTGGATTAPPVSAFTTSSTMSSAMNSWWQSYGQRTGDNVREEPYGYIYPRLTTKSNTYTVHVITQILQKASTTDPTLFVDGQDQVTSEYRGSVIVQRYLDPNADTLMTTDGTTPANPETYPNSMAGPYKFRIVGTKRFAP